QLDGVLEQLSTDVPASVPAIHPDAFDLGAQHPSPRKPGNERQLQYANDLSVEHGHNNGIPCLSVHGIQGGCKRTLHPPVFVASAAFTLITVIFAVAAPSSAQATFSAIQEWILRNASWVYILTVAIILLSVVFLAVSRYGDIKLGPDHS